MEDEYGEEMIAQNCIDYKIVSSGGYPNSGSYYDLQLQVFDHIQRGWKPIGGIAVFQESTGGGMHSKYFQAMIKIETFKQRLARWFK